MVAKTTKQPQGVSFKVKIPAASRKNSSSPDLKCSLCTKRSCTRLNVFVVFWAVSRHPLPWLEPYLALVLRPLAPLLPTTIAYRGATAKTTNLFRAENDKHI